MLQSLRVAHWTIIVILVLGFVQPQASPEASSVPAGSQVYIGQTGRLTALIPDDWRVPVTHRADYEGDDGFVWSEPMPGDTIEEACAVASSPQPDQTFSPPEFGTWQGALSCTVDGDFGSQPFRAIVVPYREPVVMEGATYRFAVLATDPGHFDEIAATLDVTDSRVTPVTYLSSVIDIVEARSWYTSDVDWTFIRSFLLQEAEDVETLAEAADLINVVLGYLHPAGDRHSLIVPTSDPGGLADTVGLGMLVGDRQVLAVYEGSPADRAGVRRGDVIRSMNGLPFSPMRWVTDPGFLFEASSPQVFGIDRGGSAMDITITPGPYDVYLPPTGERLEGDIGYIELDGSMNVERETDYAAAGNEVLRAVDSPAVCGWIVDLRLNMGGSYWPMVSSVGSILGNGPFWGMVDREGSTFMVSWEDGSLVHDAGYAEADYLAPGTRYQPQVTSPPVAVLTSGTTGSAGEVTTVAFVGRPNTRSFGEVTGGYTVGNTTYLLWDGTLLALAESAYVDRNGTIYEHGVEPDERVLIDWSTFRTADDPVIAAAQAWLNEQQGCHGGTATPVATPSA